MVSNYLIKQGYHPNTVKQMSTAERWAAKRKMRGGFIYRSGQRLGKIMGTQVGKGVQLNVSPTLSIF
jgi:hypothetical protein